MKIFHILPDNFKVCGGIKVHAQLSQLEKELGYESFLAFPSIQPLTWFKNSCTIISHQTARFLCTNKDIVIGWEDPSAFDDFDAKVKVCYIQGDVYYLSPDKYKGKQLWVNSAHVKETVGKNFNYLISPYIDSSVFFPDPAKTKMEKKPFIITLQMRKDGRYALDGLVKILPSTVREKILWNFIADVTEEVFANALRKSDMFFAHSYPEGFNLTPLEAMACGTLVFGYTGGGAKEFMQNGKNCFFSADGDTLFLSQYLTTLLNKKTEELHKIINNGIKTAEKYSKENTKNQLREVLHNYATL